MLLLAWNIGVTDVTKNSRFCAVTLTACSMLLLDVRLNCFFHPSTSSTPSVRADSPNFVATSFETDIFTTQVQQDTRSIRGIVMRVASGLCSWSVAGLLAFQVASLHLQSIMDLCPSASHNISIFPS